MAKRYVAFLRGIAHVPMQPFRDAMAELGFTGVTSFGMSGNLAFTATTGTVSALQKAIGDRLKTAAIVLPAAELRRVAKGVPFAGRPGSALMLFAKRPPAAKQKALLAEDPSEPPVFSGRAVYFVHPLTRTGKRSAIDLERALGTIGTARSSKVLQRIAEQLDA